MKQYMILNNNDCPLKKLSKEAGRKISEFDQGTVVCLIMCYMFDMVIDKGLLKLNVTKIP